MRPCCTETDALPVKDERVPQHQLERLQSTLTDSRTSTVSYPFTVKRRRAASESTAGGTQCETRLSTVAPASVTIPGQVKITTGRKKPRREMVMLKIRMDETERWYEWMQNAFKAIQQIACRSIAKEWIKAIHPKKQSTHPYNGNMPRTERKSPDRTRPPYWPRDVKHKEPDHIDKGRAYTLLSPYGHTNSNLHRTNTVAYVHSHEHSAARDRAGQRQENR